MFPQSPPTIFNMVKEMTDTNGKEESNVVMTLDTAAHTDAVNTPADESLSTHNIRMSRISHPRATLWAITLLVVVFLGFGVLAEAAIHLS